MELANSDENPKNKEENRYSSWGMLANNMFALSYETTPKLPAGFYEIIWNPSIQDNVLSLKKTYTDELYNLPSEELMDIIKDLERFWENEKTYRKYNFLYKRGILLYGDPGCGKSGIINLCVKYLIEQKQGIVINISSPEDIERYNYFIAHLRAIEPNRLILVILEDLDSLVNTGSYQMSLILNLLDGVKQINGIVYMATTNYPEKLEERITNRPSRFDRRYEVGLPNASIREAYIRHKLLKEDLEEIDLKHWVEKTEGMSLAHIKELIVSTIISGEDVNKVLNRLKDMSIKVSSSKNKHNPISLGVKR